MEYEGMDNQIALKLASLLNDAGFIQVKSEEISVPLGKLHGSFGVDASVNFSSAYREMGEHIVRAVKGSLSADEYEKLVDGLVEEWDRTNGYTVGFTIAYGQRPL